MVRLKRLEAIDGDGQLAKLTFGVAYVPEGVDEKDIAKADMLEQIEGAVEFSSVGGDKEKRAALWARLQELMGHRELNYSLEAEDKSIAKEASVPVPVAAEGKAAIAAYLYAHGFREGSIAGALSVGERTVGQYLSDFKRGER